MPQFTRREVLGISLGTLLGVPWRDRALASAPAGRAVRYTNERQYTITHSAVVEINDVVLRSLEIWVPVPTDQPEQQIRSLKIEPKVPVVRDVAGQAAVAKLFRTTGLPEPGQTCRLQVSYQVTCRKIALAMEEMEKYRFGAYRKDRRYRHFTRPEKKIETALPAIVEQAKKLSAGERAPLDVARAAYDWLLDRTDYKLIDGFGGAAYCLNRRHGECGDYSALFVALCRAAGIPARPVVGFWADRTDGWHVWAEFMLPSGQWVPVDPAIGDQSAYNRRRYFGGLDNRRVALCKTCDIVLRDSPGGHHTAEFLQTGAWWWYASQFTGAKRRPEVRFSVAGKLAKT